MTLSIWLALVSVLLSTIFWHSYHALVIMSCRSREYIQQIFILWLICAQNRASNICAPNRANNKVPWLYETCTVEHDLKKLKREKLFFFFAKIIPSVFHFKIDTYLFLCAWLWSSQSLHVIWFISKMNKRQSLVGHCFGEVDLCMRRYKVLNKLGWQRGTDGGAVGSGLLCEWGEQEEFHGEVELWNSPGICGARGCLKQLY